ncbi:MAG TPA: hypothetical protein VMV33_17300 [Rhodocyclaceae bacterium]|nr:hypothetical protein [Rhodocyclaceae bacterium]
MAAVIAKSYRMNLAEIRLKMRDGWRDMREAPRDCSWIDGMMADQSVVRVHYACGDGDGAQRSFRGWFRSAGAAWFAGVDDPVLWRPIVMECPQSAGATEGEG